MKKGDKEWYDLIEQFEKDIKSGACGYMPLNFAKDKSGHVIYDDGRIDKLFRAYVCEYSYHKCLTNLG